ncbi:MAG: type II toxin-antitoxin system prevent-host-death family antitoxin [Solirubrobacterales bacterium]
MAVTKVSIRELHNHGGELIDRASRGERITITRSGKEVAELRPLGREELSSEELIDRFKQVPRADYDQLRGDLDTTIDPRT